MRELIELYPADADRTTPAGCPNVSGHLQLERPDKAQS